MNVVTRGLSTAGLFVYAAIHALQAVSPPEGAPGWLQAAFVVTALAALGLGGAMLVLPPTTSGPYRNMAAGLALVSAIALLLAFTTGLLGVTETDIRVSTLGVIIAESLILTSWVANRMVGPEFDEVEESVPDIPSEP